MRPRQFLHSQGKLTSPLLLRIAAINLVSLLLLSAFNYLTFYNKGNNSFRQSLTQYNQRVADLAFQNIDRQIIQNAVGIQYRFFSDITSNKTLLKPQETDISNTPQDILALHAKLRELLEAHPVVHSINIFYEATDTIVTGRGNTHFVQTAQERERYLPWYADYIAGGKTFKIASLDKRVYPVQIYNSVELAGGNDKLISVISTVKNSRWNDKNIVIAVHILPTYFAEYIDENAGKFIIADKKGREIYSTPGGSPQAAQIIAAAGEGTTGTVKLDELGVVVSRSQNDALGLRYYHAIPYAVFFKDYNSYLKELILIYLLSVLVMFVILTIISQMTNAAYHKRLLLTSRQVGLPLSERDKSFDGSLASLTTQLSTLNSEVQQSRPIAYSNYVRSLIFGKQAGAAYGELAPLLGSFEGVFCIIVNMTAAQGAKLELAAVQAQLQAASPHCHLLATTLEQNQICLAVCVDSAAVADTRTALLTDLGELFGEGFTAHGQWTPFGERREQCFKAAFDSAADICRYHFIFPHRAQLHFEEIGPVQIKNTGSHLKLFAEIEKDINSENLLEYKDHILGLTESFKCGNYSIDYCSSTLRDFVTLLYNITQSRQLDMWLTFGYDIRAHYKQIEDIDAFYRWSCELGEVLMQNLRQRKKALAPDLQSRILELIDENLEKNISLEFLADSLGWRPDVLSRTFKQLMGKNYSDYTKEKKLARAKQLIAQGLPMKDIAARLGYNSAQYFIKIFKESFGVTPYQYKKNGMSSL